MPQDKRGLASASEETRKRVARQGGLARSKRLKQKQDE